MDPQSEGSYLTLSIPLPESCFSTRACELLSSLYLDTAVIAAQNFEVVKQEPSTALYLLDEYCGGDRSNHLSERVLTHSTAIYATTALRKRIHLETYCTNRYIKSNSLLTLHITHQSTLQPKWFQEPHEVNI